MASQKWIPVLDPGLRVAHFDAHGERCITRRQQSCFVLLVGGINLVGRFDGALRSCSCQPRVFAARMYGK